MDLEARARYYANSLSDLPAHHKAELQRLAAHFSGMTVRELAAVFCGEAPGFTEWMRREFPNAEPYAKGLIQEALAVAETVTMGYLHVVSEKIRR